MAVRKKYSVEKARAKLKLRAAIMESQDKKVQAADKEKALRAQLRGM